MDKLDNTLYTTYSILMSLMTVSRQIQFQDSNVPKLAIGLLAMILLLGLFVVGYDQGQLFSVVQGEKAFEDLYIHELFHDMRHAAGFPCH